MSNGFGALTGSSRPAVGRWPPPDNPAPSLRPHYQASPLLRAGPSLCPASVRCPLQFLLLGVLPLATATTLALSGRQVHTFRTSAWTRLAPPLCRRAPGQ